MENEADNEKEVIPPDYKCKCEIPVDPMVEWVEKGSEEECRPCLLVPVVQWYSDTLTQQGHQDKAEELIKLAEAPEVTPLTVCQKLDNIKEVVEEPIRERLRDFDCSAQSFSEDALKQASCIIKNSREEVTQSG